MSTDELLIIHSDTLGTPTDLGADAVRDISGALNALLADMTLLAVSAGRRETERRIELPRRRQVFDGEADGKVTEVHRCSPEARGRPFASGGPDVDLRVQLAVVA